MQALTESRCPPESADRFRGLSFTGTAAELRAAPPRKARIASIAFPSTPNRTDDEAGTPEERAFLEFSLARGRQTLQNYRSKPLVRRIPACLRALKVDSLDAARSLLERRPDLTATALDSLLIAATSFYRDVSVFDYVREVALPSEFASNARVRILSAACSDGSELYTVAALVDRMDRLDDADLWGLDCRDSALEVARRGRYSENALTHFPESLRSAYLEPAGGNLQVRDKLRAATNWTVGNALSISHLGRWNLIFCRNLAIYLRPATSATLWHGLFRALEPGGYLVVGRAEKPRVSGLTRVGPCTYRKD
jgi:chemotaxis protein methyltransferase CheR